MKQIEIINVAEASLLTGIPMPVLYFHINANHLPARKLGRIFLIEHDDLKTFVQARRNGKYCKAGRPKKVRPVLETVVGSKELTINSGERD